MQLNRLLGVSFCFLAVLAKAEPVSMFDGTTMKGWEGDPKWWRVQDGALVGGSLEKKVPENMFLATTRNYTNFHFKTRFRLIGTNGFINSGVQIRSQRVPNNTEMSGYQCDLGDPSWWGSIYDESRRNKLMAQSDMNALNKVLKRQDWNTYEVIAEGRRIRTYLNGVLGVDYTEQDEKIVQWGRIGFQVHGGGAAEAWFKDISINELPATKESPLKAEEQLKSFTVPPGFKVELVASEPDLPKPITVTWDDSGRMWSMTAVEYPVDGNEQAAKAEALYREGGRDKVLVFDTLTPGKTGSPLLGKPHVFADGQAIPLGLLPYKDGAYVHHGTEVVFMRDTDGDGKADKQETILSGFGIQDSHLMPHQFTYAPGGWLYLAQGAFNYSKVRTKDDVVVQFNQTKLARFRPDGSEFEILTHGPCNIWGLVITRFGETWIQEANDYGYSTMPYEPGSSYPGCGDNQFRPYAPIQPSVAEFRMGGTGLSGLAMSEDVNVFPAPWRDVLFVANPITRQVQAIKIHREANGYRLEKLPDFMNSSDEWFRPISIHFGPDACLYVVDWYNKIISHNEVPRNHPDRDKTHGRVWRIRPENYTPGAIPNVAKASNEDLLKHLASGNKWEWNAALHQIAQRPAAELRPKLAAIAENGKASNTHGSQTATPHRAARVSRAETPSQPASPKSSYDLEDENASAAGTAALQIRALWALESLGQVDESLLRKLVRHENAFVRREAVRVAGTRLKPDAALALVSPLAEDSNHYVRSEVIRVAGGQDSPWKHHIISGAEKRLDRPLSNPAMEVLVSMAKPALGDANKPGPGYEREFERYLIRAALERHSKELAAFLDSSAAEKVPGDNRLFASLALPPAEAARRLGIAIEKSPRPVSDEELATMLQNPAAPEVRNAIEKMAGEVSTAKALAKGSARLRTRLNAAEVEPLLRPAAKLLLTSGNEDDLNDGLKVASGFKVRAVEPEVSGLLSKPSLKRETQVAALRALREFQSGPTDALFKLANDTSAPLNVRNEAVSTLAASHQPDAAPKLFTLWPTLNESQRKPIIDQLSGNKSGAETLLAALKNGTVVKDELPVTALERMHTVLPSHPQMNELWQEMSARMKRVLRFGGDKADYVKTGIELAGPFTVEAWVKLDKGIDNVDGILGSSKRVENALDMNFFASQFRVWVGSGQHDIVVAKRKTAPDVWTHYAVTRDAKGEFRIYINGELDATSKQRSTITYTDLDIARTLPQTTGTAGSITEFRVWNTVRTASEILASFDRSFAGEALPKALRIYFPGNNGAMPSAGTKLIEAKQMHGKARIEGTLEAPALLTAEEARALDEKFGKFRTLAEASGDLAAGKQLFTSTCLVCHQAGGQGAGFAPNLDGSALRGTEGLLRAILTPSAAMEAGYRKFRVETRDGEIYEGFLAQQDAAGVVLRQPNAEPLKIASRDIKRAGFQNVSIMPEGLLEGMPPKQVADLFTYLRSLK